MRFSDLVASSLASLRQRAFRTTLTVLGVMIGTTAVIVMVSLGVGMSQQFLGNMESNWTLRTVSVSGPPPDAAQQGIPDKLSDRLVTHLVASYPEIQSVAPIYMVDLEIRVGRSATWGQITAMPHAALEQLGLELAWGELPPENSTFSVVAGDMLNTQFWDESTGEVMDVDFQRDSVFATIQAGFVEEPGDGGGDPPAPQRFLLPFAGQVAGDGQTWTQFSQALFADLDSTVKFLQKQSPGRPLPNQPTTPDGKPLRGEFVYNEIRLFTPTPDDAEALMTTLRDAGYSAWAEIEWIREAQRQALLIQAIFGGIGFISLLVAAIGIANTMMMSVFERTREIGVMKVLGASLRDIRGMFIFESALIGMFGGLVGLALSLGVSAAMNMFLGGMLGGGMDGEGSAISIIPPWLMLGAVAFSTAIGTLAGLAPAQRAVRLSPLDAIRTQ
ncbi:MAG: ABC transporter permease [Tessaracoccus sp.]|uniref:ABC transporter permease n=1 Tax=Tessaracoccus sp. TaxID=1971211 RepID=UPI001ECE22B2|nr:ABC transporter permease [Tessaracoccus sp.]MBK7820210.1 ABC transporter permease [Tessaracoccus sp.]